jgi:hypothetical protein
VSGFASLFLAIGWGFLLPGDIPELTVNLSEDIGGAWNVFSRIQNSPELLFGLSGMVEVREDNRQLNLRHIVPRIETNHVTQDTFRGLMAGQVDQRNCRLEQDARFVNTGGSIHRQSEYVARVTVALSITDTIQPVTLERVEVLGFGSFDALPIDWLQARQMRVNGTADGLPVEGIGLGELASQEIDLVQERTGIRTPRRVGDRRRFAEQVVLICKAPIGRDVERARSHRTAIDDEDTARADTVADTQLIVDVRVHDADVRDDEIRCNELEKHVGSDIAGGSHGVGPLYFKSRLLERRLEQTEVHPLEIDERRG